jgi:hypothetical protein
MSADAYGEVVLTIDQLLLNINVSNTIVNHFTPEFYIYFVKENSSDQTKGIIMCTIGAILIDLLPASIFFGLQARHKKKKNKYYAYTYDILIFIGLWFTINGSHMNCLCI